MPSMPAMKMSLTTTANCSPRFRRSSAATPSVSCTTRHRSPNTRLHLFTKKYACTRSSSTYRMEKSALTVLRYESYSESWNELPALGRASRVSESWIERALETAPADASSVRLSDVRGDGDNVALRRRRRSSRASGCVKSNWSSSEASSVASNDTLAASFARAGSAETTRSADRFSSVAVAVAAVVVAGPGVFGVSETKSSETRRSLLFRFGCRASEEALSSAARSSAKRSPRSTMDRNAATREALAPLSPSPSPNVSLPAVGTHITICSVAIPTPGPETRRTLSDPPSRRRRRRQNCISAAPRRFASSRTPRRETSFCVRSEPELERSRSRLTRSCAPSVAAARYSMATRTPARGASGDPASETAPRDGPFPCVFSSFSSPLGAAARSVVSRHEPRTTRVPAR